MFCRVPRKASYYTLLTERHWQLFDNNRYFAEMFAKSFAESFYLNLLITQVQPQQFNVLVTTYEYIMRDRAKLCRLEWKYIIIDEAQVGSQANTHRHTHRHTHTHAHAHAHTHLTVSCMLVVNCSECKTSLLTTEK